MDSENLLEAIKSVKIDKQSELLPLAVECAIKVWLDTLKKWMRDFPISKMQKTTVRFIWDVSTCERFDKMSSTRTNCIFTSIFLLFFAIFEPSINIHFDWYCVRISVYFPDF